MTESRRRPAAARRAPRRTTARAKGVEAPAPAPPVTPVVNRLHGTDLSTGLVDYAMWMELFGEVASEEAATGLAPAYRRGRVWA
jgi:cyanobactin cluster PatC/TenC/TruC protein